MSIKQKNFPKIANPEKYFEENQSANKKPKFWRSLNILNNPNTETNLEAKKMEFPEGQDHPINLDKMNPVSRRRFLALMTASGVFATAACTDYRDKGQIVNYSKKPESIQPGISNFFASTYAINGKSYGVLVKAREGRPIKVDGNPEHPITQGKSDVKLQATILDLYDPSRLKKPLTSLKSDMKLDDGKVTETTWDKIDSQVMDLLNKNLSSNKEIAILTGAILSPTTNKLFQDFQLKYPNTKVYSYESFDENSKNAAWMDSYGVASTPGYNLENPDVILSIDCDFLGVDGNQIENTLSFTKRRNIDNPENFNRLYTIEAAYSLTGGNSDYRFRLSPEMQYEFVMSLTNELTKKSSNIALTSEVKALLSKYDLNDFAKNNSLNSQKLTYLVNDLDKKRGKSLILSGRQLPKNVHIAVNLLNEVLGNTVNYKNSVNEDYSAKLSSENEINELLSNLNSGKVDILINIDVNPVYNLPTYLNFDQAIKKANNVITFAISKNETTAFSDMTLPSNHFLESWGDYLVNSSTISLQQPVINPLYDSRQPEAALLSWMSGEKYYYDSYHIFIINRWQSEVFPRMNTFSNFNDFWFNSLHDGVVKFKNQLFTNTYVFNQNAILNSNAKIEKSGLTLLFTESPQIADGYYANNGFLQEIPHPISKITWDNPVSISPATSKKLGVDFQDLLDVTLNGITIALPVVVQPGMADDVLQVDMGYGRKVIGDIGKEVGFDVNKFRKNKSNISPWVYTGVSAKKGAGTFKLATTQEHHQLDEIMFDKYKLAEFHLERQIVQTGTVEDYIKDPKRITHRHNTTSIMSNHKYEGNKWAMAIDMNKCTGCNACITSCDVESNIPVVGKDEVLVGREMHWMRMDRYYAGEPEDPRMSIQPMLCQHCDNAPCENVCPVVATTHSPDGINQMVYNRCVGTRYCGNNCPYKVRRFNFFDFRNMLAEGYYYSESVQHMYNPEVTVRSRGVMEKCDFCTSRISEGRSNATKENRDFNGNDIRTACQDACPANAIYFGNSNDSNSLVSKLRNHNLAYGVLEVLDVKPQVTYLAKLHNIIPEVKDGEHGNHH